jgi:hypothetical protein
MRVIRHISVEHWLEIRETLRGIMLSFIQKTLVMERNQDRLLSEIITEAK